MKNEYSVIVTTCANRESAKAVATALLEKRLAACVQMFPIESMYVWKGETCNDSEIALLIKSHTALFNDITAAIKGIHTYEVPEIIQIPITNGLPDYLKWIDDSLFRDTKNQKGECCE
jgi:periplasmic divalent cation tolerance protein